MIIVVPPRGSFSNWRLTSKCNYTAYLRIIRGPTNVTTIGILPAPVAPWWWSVDLDQLDVQLHRIPSFVPHYMIIRLHWWHGVRWKQGRDHALKVGGPNRAKPESRAWSARDLRAKPKSRAKLEKKRGRGLGRGLGEPLSNLFL